MIMLTSIIVKLQRVGGKLFTKHLFVTNATIGLIITGAGDAIQQSIEHRLVEKKPFDKQRIVAMSTSGIVLGALGHYWYGMLDRRFPGTKAVSVIKKLLSEMALSPPFALVMFQGVGLLEGRSQRQCFEDYKENIFTVLMFDYSFFLPFQTLNFIFLPPRFRVGYVGTLTLIYDIFMSYIIHKEDTMGHRHVTAG
ncbi:mpv17-like protein 2 [Limulus polyphemus]|uniref:Mpv17-like protein 2 n=1 Tax=Limulus polyphemus TaxID=6850 RepID=A0ABM1BKC9_LIMPO|nr:mpv17-like protein 2 [Limulus polyphemus]XP_013783721.1 mpv17-like protein 2 [Limulus polyphemus]XP_022251801.1 mpv17-like protein 2 [Limulus polyphemus]XP_022251802.1 mpv17-like protein 2 [Limulus polyphemus]